MVACHVNVWKPHCLCYVCRCRLINFVIVIYEVWAELGLVSGWSEGWQDVCGNVQSFSFVEVCSPFAEVSSPFDASLCLKLNIVPSCFYEPNGSGPWVVVISGAHCTIIKQACNPCLRRIFKTLKVSVKYSTCHKWTLLGRKVLSYSEWQCFRVKFLVKCAMEMVREKAPKSSSSFKCLLWH